MPGTIVKDKASENNIENKKKCKVLVVEDDPINQFMMKTFLEEYNCEIGIAKNGQEAITMYQDNYDLVFMDYDLPDMLGSHVCKTIYKIRTRNKPVVIALTSQNDKQIKEECFNSGMSDFITKPINSKLLGAVLKRWLALDNQLINYEEVSIGNF